MLPAWVETVIDYFNRWVAKFPTVEALAAVDQQEGRQAWEGSGYYARARQPAQGCATDR